MLLIGNSSGKTGEGQEEEMAQAAKGVDADGAGKIPPRERILAAADDLFIRFGIRGVGVEAIAEAAGTNKMTLYRHFPSKDDLVAAWLQGMLEEWNEVWSRFEALPENDPKARVDAFLAGIGDAFEDCAVRGCPFMNSLAELPEKDHPARRVLDEYKAMNRKRMTKFFRAVGIADPSQTADEIQLLFDGAKAGIQDAGVAKSRARFIKLAHALLDARLPR
jgi:AcrR family transcriptional regulator